jgi:hypothetical protein
LVDGLERGCEEQMMSGSMDGIVEGDVFVVKNESLEVVACDHDAELYELRGLHVVDDDARGAVVMSGAQLAASAR